MALTRKQRACLAPLIAGNSIAEVARQTNTGESTIRAWLSNPKSEFYRALQRAMEDTLDGSVKHTAATLARISEKALVVIERILDNSKSADAQIRAAALCLDKLSKLYQLKKELNGKPINDIPSTVTRVIQDMQREARYDSVWVEDIMEGPFLLKRYLADFLVKQYPTRYSKPSGPETWSLRNEEGDVIDVNYSLDDPDLSDEDRVRILQFRESLAPKSEATPNGNGTGPRPQLTVGSPQIL